MSTKTDSLTVWLPDYYASKAIRAASLPIHMFAFISPQQDMRSSGWVQVGTAEVAVTFESQDAVNEAAAAAIRAQMAEAAAKHQAVQTELQARLNSLLAITNEVDA